jgi:hypothetical protein
LIIRQRHDVKKKWKEKKKKQEKTGPLLFEKKIREHLLGESFSRLSLLTVLKESTKRGSQQDPTFRG